jgi:hypothetical protein
MRKKKGNATHIDNEEVKVPMPNELSQKDRDA